MQLLTTFVLLALSISACVCDVNIARGKPTQQDSTGWSGFASRAVDGDRDGNYGKGSCTHTSLKGPHFWTVDLLSSFSVGKITIYNRQDCCADRLTNLEVYLSDDNAVKTSEGNDKYKCAFYKGPAKEGQKSITICCGGMKGRYLSILKKTGYLTLCEVEVFKAPTPPNAQEIPSGGNIAQGKEARQDSTGWGGVASRAVDGNRDGNFGRGSCTHTSLKGPHFWSVDLKGNYSIGYIRITNRQDCCADRLNNLEVYLSDDKAVKTSHANYKYRCAFYKGPPKKEQKSINIFCCGRSGRYLSILKKTGYLTLCEVEVFKAAP